VADSQDRDALDQMARRTQVVATTVGPYARYGMPLVEACAAAGTNYCDLTGEVLFIRESIDNCHATAESSGARIVHTCGFDSIPSDLSAFLLHHELGELADTTLVVTALRGGASGGTIASIKDMVDDAKRDSGKRKLLGDPYSLSPQRDAEPNVDGGDLRGVEQDQELGMWIAPFLMSAINTRVVRRSNALQDWAYGRRFRYREVTGFKGAAAPLKAAGLAAGLGAFAAGLAIPVTRPVLDRFLPSPGEGPDEEARRNGFFRIETHTRTAGGEHRVCNVKMQGDPGYAATAVMFGEAALCLARDQEQLPPRAGVLTPATAMGMPLVERLRRAGMTLEVAPAG